MQNLSESLSGLLTQEGSSGGRTKRRLGVLIGVASPPIVAGGPVVMDRHKLRYSVTPQLSTWESDAALHTVPLVTLKCIQRRSPHWDQLFFCIV